MPTSPIEAEMIDCVWLASDRLGRLAAFVTAGQGPIPKAAFDGSVDLFDLETLLLDLPVSARADMCVQVPRPDSFVDLAERGLFVYDWTDIHRTGQGTNAYELVARPSDPRPRSRLPEGLRRMAESIVIELEFAGTRQVPRTLLPA